MSSIKTIAFRIEEEFHTAVKVQAAKEKKTLQDYIIEILQKDIAEKDEKAKNENEKNLHEQLFEAALKKNPEIVTLHTDENGHVIIDKDLHPDIYDWAVNG